MTVQYFMYYVGTTKMFPEMIEDLREVENLQIDEELAEKIRKRNHGPFDLVSLFCSLDTETGEIKVLRLASYEDYKTTRSDRERFPWLATSSDTPSSSASGTSTS